MKEKRDMDESYFMTLQERLFSYGFITIGVNSKNGKTSWLPTAKGISFYKTILELTHRNRLFKGPKFTDYQLAEFKDKRESRYNEIKRELVKRGFLTEIYDKDLDDSRYELTEYAYEFWQLYSKTITKGNVYPGPRLLYKLAVGALHGINLVCFTIIQAIIVLVRRHK